jgi:hypothetical protein
MNLDCAFGQIQLLRYKLIWISATDQSRDLLLTASEHFEPHAAVLFFRRWGHNRHNAQLLGAVPKIATCSRDLRYPLSFMA